MANKISILNFFLSSKLPLLKITRNYVAVLESQLNKLSIKDADIEEPIMMAEYLSSLSALTELPSVIATVKTLIKDTAIWD